MHEEATTAAGWPRELPVDAVRVARTTDRLDRLRAFYGDLLGLPQLGAFTDHAGYSGVIYGLPDERHQLEFTEHRDGGPCPPPSRDSLVVLYFCEAAAVDALVARLADHGYPEVEPENPYWGTTVDGVTVEDPDGWRVVLVKPGTPRRRQP